jgi:hypothetical protein
VFWMQILPCQVDLPVVLLLHCQIIAPTCRYKDLRTPCFSMCQVDLSRRRDSSCTCGCFMAVSESGRARSCAARDHVPGRTKEEGRAGRSAEAA